MGEDAEYREPAAGNGLHDGDLQCNAVSKAAQAIEPLEGGLIIRAHRNSGRRTGAWESAMSMSAAPHMSMRNPLIQSWLNAYALTTCAHGQGQERHGS